MTWLPIGLLTRCSLPNSPPDISRPGNLVPLCQVAVDNCFASAMWRQLSCHQQPCCSDSKQTQMHRALSQAAMHVSQTHSNPTTEFLHFAFLPVHQGMAKPKSGAFGRLVGKTCGAPTHRSQRMVCLQRFTEKAWQTSTTPLHHNVEFPRARYPMVCGIQSGGWRYRVSCCH